MANNLDLAETRERIVAARARRGIRNAERLPQLDGTAGYQYSASGDEAFSFNGAPPGEETDLYSLGVVAGWEVDLWGRVARLVEAADAEVAFAVEDVRAARVALAAEVARELVLIRALDAEMAVVRAGIGVDEDTLSIARVRLRAGLTSELDALRAERVLEADRALLPQLVGDRREALNRLTLLLGERPGEVVVEPAVLPTQVPVPALGVPADMLVRRPDIRRAERELAAAAARTGAAVAERYPRVSISGSLELQGPDIADAVNPDAHVLSVGPSLSVPLFNAGRIRSSIDQARSVQRQALLRLTQAVLRAMNEVETAAEQRRRAVDRFAFLKAAEVAAQRTEALARDRYQAGTADFLEVTEATTQRLAIERDRIRAHRDTLLRLSDLYAALGGGWDVDLPRSLARDNGTGFGHLGEGVQ